MSDRSVVFVFDGEDTKENYNNFCKNICGTCKIGDFGYKQITVKINDVEQKWWVVIYHISDLKGFQATTNINLKGNFCFHCNIHFNERCKYTHIFENFHFRSIFNFRNTDCIVCLLHLLQRGTEKFTPLHPR